MQFLLYSILGIAAIGLLFSGNKNSTDVASGVSLGNFLDSWYLWLWIKEGGLNNGSAGGDHKLPMAPIKVNGEEYHTSRGITVPTMEAFWRFKNLQPNWQDWVNFSLLDSPNKLWKDVVDFRGRQAVQYTSQPVLQRYMMLWYFGGWDQNIISKAQVQAVFADNISNKMKLRLLVNLRKQYFDGLVDLGRASADTGEAWKARAENFYDNFSKYV